MTVDVTAPSALIEQAQDAAGRLRADGWVLERRGDDTVLWHPEVLTGEEALERLRRIGIDPDALEIDVIEFDDDEDDDPDWADEDDDLDQTNLARAFDEMRRRGLFAEEAYMCCPACGFRAVRDVMTAAARGGGGLPGYAFYSGESAEYLLAGESCRLFYGSVRPDGEFEDEKLDAGVAGTVCECLEQHGLEYTWAGEPLTSDILIEAGSVY